MKYIAAARMIQNFYGISQREWFTKGQILSSEQRTPFSGHEFPGSAVQRHSVGYTHEKSPWNDDLGTGISEGIYLGLLVTH